MALNLGETKIHSSHQHKSSLHDYPEELLAMSSCPRIQSKNEVEISSNSKNSQNCSKWEGEHSVFPW